MWFRALSALLLTLFLTQSFAPISRIQQAQAAGGFTSGALGTALNGGSVSDIFIQGVKGAAIGAVSASLTFGIGHMGAGGNSIFNSFGKVGETIGKGVAHGLVQGGMSKLQGGNFASGAIGGALSSVGGSFYEGKGLTHSAIRVAVAAVAGGTAAEIAGGDFVNGAISGAYVQMFNDVIDIVVETQKRKAYVYSGDAPLESLYGEYYGHLYDSAENREECAANVQGVLRKFGNANIPETIDWQAGPLVKDFKGLRVGTAIGTFTGKSGNEFAPFRKGVQQWENHAAIYLGHDKDFLYVAEAFHGKKFGYRAIPWKNDKLTDRNDIRVNTGEQYRIITSK